MAVIIFDITLVLCRTTSIGSDTGAPFIAKLGYVNSGPVLICPGQVPQISSALRDARSVGRCEQREQRRPDAITAKERSPTAQRRR